MSFQQGLSGLSASSQNLDVIGNNIANANTTGMKASRAEFADLYASSLGGNSGAGIGVTVAAVSQQFSQGNISSTGNPLDVAINNSGFFQLTTASGSMAYTRDGARAVGRGDEIGTLSVGKSADFIVLDRDILAVPITEVSGTKVLATWFMGKKVYAAP